MARKTCRTIHRRNLALLADEDPQRPWKWPSASSDDQSVRYACELACRPAASCGAEVLRRHNRGREETNSTTLCSLAPIKRGPATALGLKIIAHTCEHCRLSCHWKNDVTHGLLSEKSNGHIVPLSELRHVGDCTFAALPCVAGQSWRKPVSEKR